MRAVLLILCSLLASCSAYNPSLLTTEGSGSSSGPTSGPQTPSTLGGSGGGDAMSSTGGTGGTGDSCGTIPERCNGADEDCDGHVDEMATCALAYAESQCTSGGICELTACTPGHFDCNDMQADGCEATRDTANCGQCPEACATDDAGSGTGGTTEPAEVPDASPDAGMMSMPDAAPPPDPCLALAPSGRGATCDACICMKCANEIDDCEGNPDATLAMKCDDVIQCYRINDCKNCGGTTTASCTDCYDGGSGPCVGEVRIAAGGTDANDTGPLAAGNCSNMTPEMNACAAATAMAACREAMCPTECM